MKKILATILMVSFLFSACNLFKKDSQKAVNEGLTKLLDVKKMSSSFSLKGILQPPAGEKPANVQFSLVMTGKGDSSNEKVPQADMNMKWDLSLDAEKGSGEFLLKIMGQELFVNLKNIVLPGPLGEQLKTQLASLLNTWWLLPLGQENPIGKFSEEQRKLRETLKMTNFFTNAKEEGQDEMNGISMVRYRVDLDKEALKRFLSDAVRLTKSPLDPKEEGAIEEALKEIEFSGAVGIGKKDDALHRLRGTFTIRPKQGSVASFEVDYNTWDYGKSVEIEKPKDAKPFNPLMVLPLLGAFGNLNQGTSSDLAVPKTLPAKPLDQPLGKKQIEKKK